jgi:hypothetical protein
MVSVSKALRMAVFGAALLVSVPSYAADNIFKSSEFLTWDKEGQGFYIRTSVAMAGLIVGQTSKAQSKCIDDWFVSEEQAGYSNVLSIMRQYPEHHPRGVLLAIMEKRCGKFEYSSK